MAAVSQDGYALQHAAASMREDRDVVTAAVSQNGCALKYALGGLNQDANCLKSAGIWSGRQGTRPEKGLYSVKFSLAATSSTYATAVVLKMQEIAGEFDIF